MKNSDDMLSNIKKGKKAKLFSYNGKWIVWKLTMLPSRRYCGLDEDDANKIYDELEQGTDDEVPVSSLEVW